MSSSAMAGGAPRIEPRPPKTNAVSSARYGMWPRRNFKPERSSIWARRSTPEVVERTLSPVEH